MQYSHSRIECYNQCPFKFKCRYRDNLRVIEDFSADSPLTCGNAMHKAIETTPQEAEKWYYRQYNIIDDEHITEMIKVYYYAPKVRNIIDTMGHCTFEYEINQEQFRGFVDLMITNGDGTVDVLDFKYTNNYHNYISSPQLHLYKYFLEREGFKVRNIGYIFIPKISLKQESNESIEMYRKRILQECEKNSIKAVPVAYNIEKVQKWFDDVKRSETESEFKKNVGYLCNWCQYKKYCLEGEDYMLLPSSERRNIQEVTKRKIWIYGGAMSGKTTLVDSAPNPLNLNTDGNVQFVTMPYISIKDKVWYTGRLKNTQFAWEMLLEVLDELEKKDNDFKTIVLDLMEDSYEMCRLYMYNKLGITHESDDSFRAWDKVRTQFLSTMRRFFNLDYENLIILSHEDTTKDITNKTGEKYTSIKPNISGKVATKLAGMVDIVARITKDEDKRYLNFKYDDIVFGGGRLKNINDSKIPLDWDELMKVYENANKSLTNDKNSDIIKSASKRSRL